MKYLFVGTSFTLVNKLDMARKPVSERYMLVETHESNYVFQIVCVSGYSTGRIFGYVKRDPQAVMDNVVGVTEKHLIKEIERNIMFEEGTLNIYEDNREVT